MISKKKRPQGTVVRKKDVNDLLNSLDLYGTVQLPPAEVVSISGGSQGVDMFGRPVQIPASGPDLDILLNPQQRFLDTIYPEGMFGSTDEEYDAIRRQQLDFARRSYMGELTPEESYMQEYFDRYGGITASGAATPVYPMNWVSPSGDLEAIISSIGQVAEGDYLGGLLSGSLALGAVFLPGSVQVGSTKGGGVFEKMIDKDGNINRNSVLSIANKEGVNKGEASVLNKVAESMPDKVPYTQFKQAVSDELAFVTSQISRYGRYGVDNVFDDLADTPIGGDVVVSGFDARRLVNGYNRLLIELDVIKNRSSFDREFNKIFNENGSLTSGNSPFSSSYQITRSEDIMGMFDWYERDYPYFLNETTINTVAGEQLKRQGFSKELLKEDPKKAMDIVMETMAGVNTNEKISPKTGAPINNTPTKNLVARYDEISDDIEDVIDGVMSADDFYDKYRFDLLEEENGVSKLNFFYDTVDRAQIENNTVQAVRDQYRPSPTAQSAIDRAIAEMDAAGFGGVRSETHLLSNPSGNYPVSGKHFGEKPTAHIRTFESHTRPESLFVSELQSDALQSFRSSGFIDLGLELGKKGELTKSTADEYLRKAMDLVDSYENIPPSSASDFFKSIMSKHRGKDIEAMRREASIMSEAIRQAYVDVIVKSRLNSYKFLEVLESNVDFFLNNSSRDISIDWSDFYDIPDQAIPKAAQKSQYKRLVQESTRIAAEKGKTKVLFPTGNTIFEIEGWKAMPPEEAALMVKPYNNLNKDIKKALGVDAKKVEIQGNTWWEVEIPESYLKGEQEITAFGQGGRMRILKRKKC